jgi:hypothetical protein
VIRPVIGDLVAVNANDRYYYAIILSKVRLFGAPLVFAFHRTSETPLTAEQIAVPTATGFHEFVDFIWAKRENRLSRIATKIDTVPFETAHFFKSTHTTKGKATLWFIYDASFSEVRRTKRLSKEEKTYPLRHRIDDTIMCALIDKHWMPGHDERI